MYRYKCTCTNKILAMYTVQLASFPGSPPLVCNYCMTFKLVLARNCKCDFKSHVIIKRRQLESLIGTLNHACKVVRCGRSFLRRMLNLLHGVPAPPMRLYLIRLNRAFRSDLMWWHTFAMAWNGVSFLLSPSYLPQLQMASDASGSWGCGAWHGCHWFQLQWDERSAPLSIMAKELLPIVLAVSVWGPRWNGHRIICLCDNQAVVACLHSRTSRVGHIMHMLRALTFVEAQHSFSLIP